MWETWLDASSALWIHGGRHLLQATLFATVVFLVVVLLGRGPARLRHGLCVVASVKFLVPSALLGVLVSLTHFDLAGRISSGLHGVVPGPVGDFLYWLLVPMDPTPAATAAAGSPWVAALVAAWAAGLVVLTGRWWRQHRAFRHALAHTEPLRRGRERQLVEQWQDRLGLRRPVRVMISDQLPQPGVWGVLRPTVVLPAGMAAHLKPAELEAVILHELVHVQRWDNLVATVQRLLCCLFWFHPLLWLLDRRLRVERERVCDEQVVMLLGTSRPYARGLLKVLRFGVGFQLAGVSGAVSHLRQRLDHITGATPRRSWPRPVQAGLLAGGVLFFCVFSLMALRPPCNGQGEVGEGTVVAAGEPGATAAPGGPCPKTRPESRAAASPSAG